MTRTLTAHDDLELHRVGYERGDVLRRTPLGPVAHSYRVDTASPLVADGLVRVDEVDGDGVRFLDTNLVPLTVRDLRRFRILVKVADAVRSAPGAVPPSAESVPSSPDLVDLRDDALDNGLLDGVDFTVGSGPAGDECITFDGRPDGFVVGYRDGGSASTLFASRSFAQARAVFLDEACWLGAERGRGPYVGRDQAVGTEGWTSAQVVAAYERRLLEGV
ncbi:hypothetical protein [Cellulomonas sp. Root137]|uniref:hypothetical protein n=1 Tax=Cellulomonas sp. Root137 TaxID=1736459 RepID=UPI0006FC73AE|nr:hypothetical protein [Cellulomonas sp. Root137]KQY46559.1 hypothetical protein ASD18_03755 [Cellulomonas sp. Root137]